jgi:hypothetical protein
MKLDEGFDIPFYRIPGKEKPAMGSAGLKVFT